MNNISNIAKYSIHYDKKLKTLCEPIDCFFSVPLFSYYKIGKDNRITYLSNYAEQLDFYFNHGCYRSNPFLVHPDLVHSGYVIHESAIDSSILDTMSKEDKKFQIYNCFVMLQKDHEGSLEGFLFADRKAPAKSVDYLANLNYLKKFALYFKHETHHLVVKMENEGYDISKAMGASFLTRDPSLPLSVNKGKLDKFLKSITELTQREQQCLSLFCQGHSAQATAAILNLSRRTVEHYFENIKDKLGCQSKWELLKYNSD